jgi:hypothetical protein
MPAGRITLAASRFEILLPRLFNDGRSVPEELFADTSPSISYKTPLLFPVGV